MKTKNIYLLLIVLSSVIGLVSCETGSNLQPEGQWELSAPVILTPTENQIIILDEDKPNEAINFSWEAAESSAGYAVTYEVFIDTLGTTDFSTPILTLESSNRGTDTFASISYKTLNKALAYTGYGANKEAQVALAIKANSLSKSNQTISNLKVVRFENEIIPSTLFISGTATENNADLSEAIALRRLTNSSNTESNVHEVYTSLVAGETYRFYNHRSLPALQYGGKEGNLEFFGDGIVAENSGQFRIQVDLDNNTYELLQISNWSIVGDSVDGGNLPMAYQGNGIWRATISLLTATGNLEFRANGDDSYILKRIMDTPNMLIIESEAANQGKTTEDIPNNRKGTNIVLLNLSADSYTYTFESFVPEELYLFENGIMIEALMKSGRVFSTERFIPMQADNTYTLNSAMDESGVAYSVNAMLADSTTPDADRVSETLDLCENENPFTLTTDRALRFNIDFSDTQLTWTYNNFKLFYWDVWEQRDEFLMSYSHPNTYTVMAELTVDSNSNSNYQSKFFSPAGDPWEFDMGSDDPTSLTGMLINRGGSNLRNITEPEDSATYEVTIELDDDYQSGSYEFKKQE